MSDLGSCRKHNIGVHNWKDSFKETQDTIIVFQCCWQKPLQRDDYIAVLLWLPTGCVPYYVDPKGLANVVILVPGKGRHNFHLALSPPVP